MKCSPDHNRADPHLWSCSSCLGFQWQASKWALGSLTEGSESLPSQSCNKWHRYKSRPKANHITITKKAVFNPGNFVRILFLVNCIYNIFYTVWNIKKLPDFFPKYKLYQISTSPSDIILVFNSLNLIPFLYSISANAKILGILQTENLG